MLIFEINYSQLIQYEILEKLVTFIELNKIKRCTINGTNIKKKLFYIFTEEEQKSLTTYHDHGFSAYVSDKIAIDRSVPDIRHTL